MDPDDCLNILEQRANWARLTTNIAYCFAWSETADISAITSNLQHAFEKLTASFPWIAGKVINEGSSPTENNTGIFRIVPRDSRPQITVKDHRQTPAVPDIHMLRQAGFATSLLDEAIFAPRPTLALKPGEVNAVLLVQANIVSGGFILQFSSNHSAMDIPGQAQVIRWFAKACCSESFTPAELGVGNMQRRHFIPLLDSTYQPGDELLQQTPPALTVPRTESRSVSITGQATPRWATFMLSSASVTDLKAIATATRSSAYISTDDALSAFLWQSIARVRSHRLGPDIVSTAGRAINVRRALDIASAYPGLVQNTLYHKLSLRELTELPLGAVASLLRDTITSPSPSVGFYSRAVATVLSRSVDKGFLKIAARLDLSRDILLTSHATMGTYELDFALGLGVAEAVRLTRLVEYESLTYLLPATLAGDIAVTVCLREEELLRLRADSLFTQYAQYLG